MLACNCQNSNFSIFIEACISILATSSMKCLVLVWVSNASSSLHVSHIISTSLRVALANMSYAMHPASFSDFAVNSFAASSTDG